jgi:chemotaxis receptor (MCP) glutamine deamidase CheD
VTEGTRDEGQGSGGISTRAAPWLAWSLVTLSVALLVGGLSFALMSRSSVPEERPYYGSVTLSVLALAFSVVGAIIASRQPRNAIGWLLCSVGVTMGLNSFAGDYAEFWLASGFGIGALGVTAAWFSSWSWIILVFVPTSFLLLLFPDGQLPSPRWRPVAWCAALGLIGFLAGYTLNPGPLDDFPQITNPYGVDSPILDAVALAGGLLASASMAASAVSLIVRMLRAGRAQRQQIKWLAYGGAVVVGAVFMGSVISVWSGDVGIAVISLGLLGVPIFTGVAIARYRLYDIDIVINRTLVYGALTAALVAVYFGGVATLQALFRATTGQEQQPQLAIVVSTLAIAALFDPLRRRIQAFIDRRFYRRKYDAQKTLETFSSRLRDETDLDALSGDLEGVVRETMQPAYVSLWLRPDKASKGQLTE